MGDFDDKVAIVSGAGSGIGRATVWRFVAEGAAVVCVDMDAVAAQETVAAIEGVDAGRVTVVAGSVADEQTWTDALAAAEALGGGVDVVHLNAGLYGFTGAIEDLPIELYRRTVDTNIGGVVLGTRAVVPALRARGGGAIVVTASVAGIVPFPPNPLYTLTKQGVAGFVVAMAPNLEPQGITIDAVCPGVVDTPMTVGALQGADPTALGFPMITPEQIADTVLHLAATAGTGRLAAVLPFSDTPIEWAAPQFADLYRSAPSSPS